MVVIDGKKISTEIKEEIKKEVLEYREKFDKTPGLAVVLVGENPASKVYVNSKVKSCGDLGFYSEKHVLEENSSEEEVLELIDKLNENEKINGILVQLPLPKHIDEKKVTNRIASEKDVDGFKPENLGKVMIGEDDGFKSCTPYGVIELLKRTGIEIAGKDAVIVGRSNIVGKPLVGLLISESATVTICHSRTKNLAEKTKEADILIAAVGKAGFITKDMVKEGAVVIDVGINRNEAGKLCGDVAFEEVAPMASAITPVPGGVGPMTIAMLMKNTMESFKKSL
ncbi:bifunctional methylenetetrahydrofolate dehydrogenase/methenyltetrahydrofolate cyclohydrolase FolD [uncultured Ilyobacter sp.]|uniref:bifunctional methylenetetrahydrofolate dehydrogenase/methenyltetrahydrofolate cyclohydrolase FolD n=1 Tax=uncultured Ilyobacter sp. TaxID=544433 RepID=UPI0029C7900E|nr:bifunctional methylenetetrahydrofolate dehydrogenase/methenyltetrahydrofolate cyclohydrolase FolD [uncultured Ilyobacter sp.]